MKSHRTFQRRDFLKTMAIAGAAPFLLPSRVWGAATPPNERVTLGFIGVGMQGRHILKNCLARSDVRVLAVCDVDSTRRESAREVVDSHYGGAGCRAFNDFRELLAKEEIDAVVIATPDHWHALNSIAAARAGKDVYCEKPMTHNVAEGRAMVKAVRDHKRVLQVGSMQRSSPEFRAACELVRNGVLGKLSHADVAIGGPGRPCDLPEEAAEPGLDWDLWLGPAPTRPYNSVLSPRGVHGHFPEWRSYREYAGGSVCDWGAHHFDIVQWACGFDDSGPVEVVPSDTPAAGHGVRIRYADGLEVTHRSGNGITFFGEKGRLYVNRGQFKLWIGDQLEAENPDAFNPLLKKWLPTDAVRLYKSNDHLSDWLECIRSRKRPICDVEIGHRTATVCHLVNLAYYHGQTLKWNPRRERFADGTGDAQWLTREYRKPWTV